jgi:hypothetical protein
VIVTTQAMDVGALTPPLWGFEEREKLMVFYERAPGARMHANYFRVGGVHQDLPRKLLDDIWAFCDPFLQVCDDLEGLLTENRIFKQRSVRHRRGQTRGRLGVGRESGSVPASQQGAASGSAVREIALAARASAPTRKTRSTPVPDIMPHLAHNRDRSSAFLAANSSGERMPFCCKSASRSILAKMSVS